ncbi:MAG: hypothetical protein Q8O72_10685 [Bacteroidales bacterium]|nr:hypothetical protein [Bacteroidales bacterium]
MFNTNIYNVSHLLLPIALRKPKTIAWLKIYISQIKLLMDIFVTYREDSLFFLAHDSRVIYLEHILNFRFNPAKNTEDPNYVGNGIYISDANTSSEVYIYNKSENVDVSDETFLHNSSGEQPFDEVYVYNTIQTYGYSGFVINVPTVFNINENKLKALVERLKLAGKIYTIKYY